MVTASEDRYVPLASCDYLVDLRQSGEGEEWTEPWSQQEGCPAAAASTGDTGACQAAADAGASRSTGEWEVLASFPFLDAGATPRLSRILLLPAPVAALIEPLRRVPALASAWSKVDAATRRVHANYTVYRRRGGSSRGKNEAPL